MSITLCFAVISRAQRDLLFDRLRFSFAQRVMRIYANLQKNICKPAVTAGNVSALYEEPLFYNTLRNLPLMLQNLQDRG